MLLVLCLFLSCFANRGPNTVKSIIDEQFSQFQSSELFQQTLSHRASLLQSSSIRDETQYEQREHAYAPVEQFKSNGVPTSPELLEKVSSKRAALQTSAPIRIRHDTTRLSLSDPYSCRSPTGSVTLQNGTTGFFCNSRNVITATKIDLVNNVILPAVNQLIISFYHIRVPVSGNFIAEPSYSSCRSANVPNYIEIQSAYRTSPGLPDTDVVIIWIARPFADNGGGLVTLANAGVCSVYNLPSTGGQDRFSRPLIASINLNPDVLLNGVDLTDPWQYDRAVRVCFHEITHALGFISTLYSSWVNPNNGNYYSPGPTTRISTVVGGTTYYRDWLTTPTVVSTARSYFSCPTLRGAPLENQEFGDYPPANAPPGSHFERSVFPNELMSPVFTYQASVSVFLLSLMSDTGWYVTNLSNAEPIIFGYQKGCGWVNDPCSTRTYPDFCTDSAQIGCVPGNKAQGSCTLQTYSPALPPQFQYDPSNPTRGGDSDYADYCWVFIPFTRGYCQQINGNQANVFDESFTSDSICWDVTFDGNRRDAACWDHRCVSDPTLNGGATTLQFNRNTSSGYTDWISCPIAGGTVQQEVQGFSLTISCPVVSYICDQVISTIPITPPPGVTPTSTNTVPAPNGRPVPGSPTSGARELCVSFSLTLLSLFIIISLSLIQ